MQFEMFLTDTQIRQLLLLLHLFFLKQLHSSAISNKATSALYSECSEILTKLLFVILENTDACAKPPSVYWRFIRPGTDAGSTRSSLEWSFN